MVVGIAEIVPLNRNGHPRQKSTTTLEPVNICYGGAWCESNRFDNGAYQAPEQHIASNMARNLQETL